MDDYSGYLRSPLGSLISKVEDELCVNHTFISCLIFNDFLMQRSIIAVNILSKPISQCTLRETGAAVNPILI